MINPKYNNPNNQDHQLTGNPAPSAPPPSVYSFQTEFHTLPSFNEVIICQLVANLRLAAAALQANAQYLQHSSMQTQQTTIYNVIESQIAGILENHMLHQQQLQRAINISNILLQQAESVNGAIRIIRSIIATDTHAINNEQDPDSTESVASAETLSRWNAVTHPPQLPNESDIFNRNHYQKTL